MSQKIDPREVLTYLNELGYTNINAQQLKEFITDLKKLIKYENKHKKDNVEKENVDPIRSYPANNYNNQCCDEFYCPNKKPKEVKQNENDVFSSLYNQPTVASKAKEVPRQGRQISVHIVRPRSTSKHEHCVHIEKQVADDENELQFVRNVEVTSDGSRLEIETESTIRSIRPSSKQTIISQAPSSKATRPKSSFIKPGYSKPFNKCDPVALYHYYQNEWKKQKFPGQENHSNLRWAVREKMLGGPKVDTVSRPSSCRRSCNSWKG